MILTTGREIRWREWPVQPEHIEIDVGVNIDSIWNGLNEVQTSFSTTLA